MSISKIMLACLANPGDPGAVNVRAESLMDFQGWINPTAAKENFEVIVEHVKKLPKPFLNAEGGWSFSNLPYFDNGHGGIGEQWGNLVDAGCLVLLCFHYGIFQDPLFTLGFRGECLSDTPNNVTFCSFNTEPHFLDLVRTHMGIK